MSGGNCQENATADSFFYTLKDQLSRVARFVDREAITEIAFKYVEVDSNRTRRHSALGYVTAEQCGAAQAA